MAMDCFLINKKNNGIGTCGPFLDITGFPLIVINDGLFCKNCKNSKDDLDKMLRLHLPAFIAAQRPRDIKKLIRGANHVSPDFARECLVMAGRLGRHKGDDILAVAEELDLV